MKFSVCILACAAIALALPPVSAQGEGNGGATLQTAVNGGSSDGADKVVASGDLVDIALINGGTPGGSPILAFTLLGCNDPQPGANFGAEMGILGVDPFGASGIIFDGLSTFPSIVVGPSLTLNLAIVVPPIFTAPTLTDFTMQGFVYDPTAGHPQGWAVSNTIRSRTVDVSSAIQDDCFSAQCVPGLSDADLGVPFNVNVALFNDDYDTTGQSGFGTQTAFAVVPAGMGSGTGSGAAKDCVVKFTATSGGAYTFDLCGSNYDSRLWLMTTNCAAPVGIVLNDDADGSFCGLRSRLVNRCMNAGDQVLIVIDGYAGSTGTASLVITKPAFDVTTVSPSSFFEGCPVSTLTINGVGFTGAIAVDFSGIPAPVISSTCTSVTVMNPGLPAGLYDVNVVNGDASTDTTVGALTVNVGPTFPISVSEPLSDDGAPVYNFACGSVVFYGVPQTSMSVCMNARVMFGTNGNTDFSETAAELRTESPTINLFWDDPFPAVANGSSVVVTETLTSVAVAYNNIPRRTTTEGFSNGTITVDKGTGEITLAYGACNTRGALAGISPGNSLFAVVPAEINLSAPGSFLAAAALDPIYEIMTGPTADPFDLSGLTIGFTPTMGNGVGPYMFHNP